MRHEKREIARAFLLNNKNRILKVQDIATGGPNFVEFNIRDIASIAVKIGATRVILVHNHPTGESKPSDADIRYTAKLYFALEFFEVDLLDHVIIANDGYTSIYEYVQKMQDEEPDKIKEILKGLKLKWPIGDGAFLATLLQLGQNNRMLNKKGKVILWNFLHLDQKT